MRLRRALVAAAVILSLRAPAWAKDEKPPPIEFLEGDAGRAAIVDEKVEPYFALLQPLEMAAKTGAPLTAKGLDAQRDECRKRYRAGVRDFSGDEKAAIAFYVAKAHAAMKDDYPLFGATPWSFLKVDEKVEGGLPHTRGKSIVLPEPFVAALVVDWRNGNDAAIPSVCGTLAHEQSHVVQRLHPEVFATLYTEKWGFQHPAEVPSDAWLDKQHLANPDGVDVRWVYPMVESKTLSTGSELTYERPFQPLVILVEGAATPRMPQDIREVAITVERKGKGEGETFRLVEDKKGRPALRQLENVPGWDALWGGIGETFHPNEAFACFFSAMVVRDRFGGTGLPRSSSLAGEDFAKFRPWCREHLVGK